MAYFDFQNTPIESDVTLKAKWCCETPSGPLTPAYTNDEMWDSDDAARLVLTDGRVVICEAADYQKMTLLFAGGSLSSSGWPNGNSNTLVSGFKLANSDGSLSPISVSGSMVQSIEMGRGYTNSNYGGQWVPYAFQSSIFPNLTMFKGFAEGTVKTNDTFDSIPATVQGAIINIPSTFTNTEYFLGHLPIGTTQSIIAKVIFNNPNFPSAGSGGNKGFISSYNYSGGSYPNAPCPPIPVTGPYVDGWMAAYPSSGPTMNGFVGRNWVKM